MEDTAKSLAFYRDLLGYEARPQNTVNDAVLGPRGDADRRGEDDVDEPPGSTNVWFFWEFASRTRNERTGSWASALSSW